MFDQIVGQVLDQISIENLNIDFVFFSLGAFTIGDRHHFENMYIGWGMKNFLESHSVNLLDTLPEKEFAFEIIEVDDPSIDEENERIPSTVLFSPDENEEFEMSH